MTQQTPFAELTQEEKLARKRELFGTNEVIINSEE